ncbi:MAG: hypothetical protein HZC47_08685 [Methanobacterium sp.]|nr:hypothetical protein [Methanobacterium sp.]
MIYKILTIIANSLTMNIATDNINETIIKTIHIISLPAYTCPNPGIKKDSTNANIGFFAIHFTSFLSC